MRAPPPPPTHTHTFPFDDYTDLHGRVGHGVGDQGEVDGVGQQYRDGQPHLLPGIGRKGEHQRGRQRQEHHLERNGSPPWGGLRVSRNYTLSIAFRHLPPNSARFSYASWGALFISAQLSSDAVSALWRVWVLITLRAPLSGTFLQTLPDLVTSLKGHSLSPRSCPTTRSAPSERFGY